MTRAAEVRIVRQGKLTQFDRRTRGYLDTYTLGRLTKGGAEGVIVMGAADGTAVALKMLDGSARATSLVALQLLASVGAISVEDADRVGTLTTEKVLGGGLPVGVIRVSKLVRGE